MEEQYVGIESGRAVISNSCCNNWDIQMRTKCLVKGFNRNSLFCVMDDKAVCSHATSICMRVQFSFSNNKWLL